MNKSALGVLAAALLLSMAGCILYFEDEAYEITYRVDADRPPMKLLYTDDNGDTLSVLSRSRIWEAHIRAMPGQRLTLGANHSHPDADLERSNGVTLTVYLEDEIQTVETYEVEPLGTVWLTAEAEE